MNSELIKVIGDKEYHFKFKSKKCIDLEKATGKDFMDLLQDTSMTNIVRLLGACCLTEGVNEYDLLDDLMSNGTSLAKVLVDIIWEAAAISGIIAREDKQRVEKALNEGNEDTLFDDEENKKK